MKKLKLAPGILYLPIDVAFKSNATRAVDAGGKRWFGRRKAHLDLDLRRSDECAANGTGKNGQARGKAAAIPVAADRCPAALPNLFRFCPEISPGVANTELCMSVSSS